MSVAVDIRKKLASFDLEVSFTAENETIGLLGASGCGKSMTMRCVAGVETPDEGRIVVNDVVYYDSAAKINLKPQQRRTALLFQNYQLFPHMTVEKNIAAGIRKDVSADEKRRIVAEEVRRFGLESFEKRYPLQLSGGQQQRVALARMLAARPSILMLDEPFSALDAHLKGLLENNLISLFDTFKGSIIYVSHDIDEAIRFCDRIVVMHEGKVDEIDEPQDLVDHPQSEAGLKISGVKDVAEVERLDDHRVHVPQWGIDIVSASELSPNVKNVGIRAFYLQKADGPGQNTYRMVVERVSDSRFDRTVTLSFVDRAESSGPAIAVHENEMKHLHQSLTWRVDKLIVPRDELPEQGDEIWIHFPEDKLYFVDR